MKLGENKAYLLYINDEDELMGRGREGGQILGVRQLWGRSRITERQRGRTSSPERQRANRTARQARLKKETSALHKHTEQRATPTSGRDKDSGNQRSKQLKKKNEIHFMQEVM